MDKKDNLSIEDSLEKIEEIIKSLENPEVPLAESLKLYTEGTGLIMQCKEAISGIEKEIQILSEQGEV